MKTELDYFQELTRIPRPSGHLDKITKYLRDYADSHNLFYEEDDAGNIVMRKGTPKVILQAHMDMVPVSDHPFNFTTQPLETYVEDGWMKARGTTLGGDDGAGMAIMLSLMERVPDIECLFTSDEETNMTGATGLKENFLKGTYLINLDHEHFQSILIGCAGGMNTDAFFLPEFGSVSGNWYTLKISGLKSGHSGLEIDQNRGNAILIAAEYLNSLKSLKIASFKGGTKPNVIPEEAEVLFSSDSIDTLNEYITKLHTKFPNENTIKITLTKGEQPKTAWTENFSRMFVETLLSVPNGVFVKDSNGVLTSSNLAIVSEENNKILVATLQRSAVNVAEPVNRVSEAFGKSGASVINYGNYPGWLLAKDAPLLKIATETYADVFGHAPIIETTHGGVECGLIQEKYPQLQVVSLGPTVENVHTIKERLEISTLEKIGTYVEALIKRLT